MINNLLFISIAPVLIIALYIYHRDKYEKEPLSALIEALFAGAMIVLPAVLIESVLTLPVRTSGSIMSAGYNGFIVAGLTEEGLKFLALFLFFWRNKNFTEKFDGIVYSVFIALGFAGVENIMYVFKGGYGVGITRALTAVPAHALFGIIMGYYFGQAKFSPARRGIYLFFAFAIPVLFHGLYDFLLLAESGIFLPVFIPVFIYYWINAFRKMSRLSAESSIRNETEDQTDTGEQV
jgi:RsiW-degrading membrane proteinase PrsW (M82 family)